MREEGESYLTLHGFIDDEKKSRVTIPLTRETLVYLKWAIEDAQHDVELAGKIERAQSA